MNDWQKRMGVGQPCHAFGRYDKTATKTTVVRADEGGRVVGTQTEHKNDRVDAKITGATFTHQLAPLKETA